MRQQPPEFTIITSSLNASSTIEQCLVSVQNQKNVSLEHIIIDGASSDGTYDIIKKIAEDDQRIKHKSEPDNGIYEAWNKGVDQASGSWILFLGADDYLLEGNVLHEVQKKISLSADSLAFISCRCRRVAGNDTSAVSRQGNRKFIENPYDGPTFSMPPQPSLLHAKAIFNSGARFDENYATAADKKLFLSFFGVASIQYIDVMTTCFTMGGVTNRDGNKIKRWFEKERMRKELNLPIVFYPYSRSFLSAVYRDLIFLVHRALPG